MQAYRTIVDGKKLSDIIDLPKAMRTAKVELIILPAPTEESKLDFEESPSVELPSDALLGCLHAYANPALAALENTAWARHAEERFGHP